jgi:MFS family permease
VNHGWRTAFACSGLAILVLVTPVILLVIRTHPSEIGLEPFGDAEATASGVGQHWGVNLRQALSVPAFWQIAAVMLLVGLATTGVGSHCVAYLTDLGHSPARAALAWSIVMGAMALGKLTFGPVSDRWGPSIAMAAASVLISASIGILMFAKPFWVVLAFAATHGFAVGAPLVVFPLLIGEHLGMRYFATIYGVLNVVSTVGAAVGPVGAGLFFDARATYLPVFGLFVVLMLVGAAVALLLKRAPGRAGPT